MQNPLTKARSLAAKFKFFFNSVTLSVVALAVFCSACSAQTESQALEQIRRMTSEGKMPPEADVLAIERKFPGTRTAALARLLRVRIRFENRDFAGAKELLYSREIKEKTRLGDYAQWFLARSNAELGNIDEAAAGFETLINEYPNSIFADDAKYELARALIAAKKPAKIEEILRKKIEQDDAKALLLAAMAAETENQQDKAISLYRRAYFAGAGTENEQAAKDKLSQLNQPLEPKNAEEAALRANSLLKAGKTTDAASAFEWLFTNFGSQLTKQQYTQNVRSRIKALSGSGQAEAAESLLQLLPPRSGEKAESTSNVINAYTTAKKWSQAQALAEKMRSEFPDNSLTAKAWIAAGLAARDARQKQVESFFLTAAVNNFPNSVEVASAQFEMAWLEHEKGNFATSSKMFIEHLARYVDKDTTNRGKAGYWAARDTEKAGDLPKACFLYDAVIYRYNANWYGYLASQRRAALAEQGKCTPFQPDKETLAAASNLKIVTVAKETASAAERIRIDKAGELTLIGLFDWAIDELNTARKNSLTSPAINLALAKMYRAKGDNTSALLALAKSYPDYSQMFPEEMGREEWEIFYPLTNWSDIKYWAGQRGLDPYQVAGLIRQESIFNPKARSSANAYGLMQLLLPTANRMARKYLDQSANISAQQLFDPVLNIQLGTAYMKEQFDRFGRIEFVAAAYNAGPNRVPQWRASLPIEIDEFVEQIPFKETKGYVQGVIRNTAQYRRLYDENGNFRPEVGRRPIKGSLEQLTPEQFNAQNPDIEIINGQTENDESQTN
jgi:soluble lytic murein transglycosylase